MNFNQRIDRIENNINNQNATLMLLKAELSKAVEFTGEFLDKCAERGITKVALCVTHKSIPLSMTFPFGAHGSVFAFQPKGVKGRGDSPPIWGVVSAMKIGGGCGNSDQHQLTSEGANKLIDGTYHLRSGKWQKVD